MKICNRCNIQIMDDAPICPLCKSKLFEDENGTPSENSYPFILGHLHRYNIAIKIMLLVSIVLAIACILVNFFTTKEVPWAIIAITTIVYCWVTTLYSIKKEINIASHICIQTFCLSIFSVIIDHVLGYLGWSVNYAIPTIITLANLAMIVVLLVNYKRYFKYIFYQLIISIFSIAPIILLETKIATIWLPTFIASLTALITFLSTIIFCWSGLKEEIKRRFHF